MEEPGEAGIKKIVLRTVGEIKQPKSADRDFPIPPLPEAAYPNVVDKDFPPPLLASEAAVERPIAQWTSADILDEEGPE